MKVRVVEKLDGTIAIHHPSQNSKHGIDGALARMVEQCGQVGLPAYDIDSSDLPSTKEYRDCWEYDQSSKKVKVNQVKKQAKDDKKAEKETAKALAKNKLKTGQPLTDNDLVALGLN